MTRKVRRKKEELEDLDYSFPERERSLRYWKLNQAVIRLRQKKITKEEAVAEMSFWWDLEPYICEQFLKDFIKHKIVYLEQAYPQGLDTTSLDEDPVPDDFELQDVFALAPKSDKDRNREYMREYRRKKKNQAYVRKNRKQTSKRMKAAYEPRPRRSVLERLPKSERY